MDFFGAFLDHPVTVDPGGGQIREAQASSGRLQTSGFLDHSKVAAVRVVFQGYFWEWVAFENVQGNPDVHSRHSASFVSVPYARGLHTARQQFLPITARPRPFAT